MTTAVTLPAGTWVIAPGSSVATFVVGGNFGKQANGTVPIIDGSVEVGPDGAPTSVRGTLNLSAIDTGIPRRDQHLRKPSLLDLDAYPTMTFRSTAVTATDEGWHVTGELGVRGMLAPIEGDLRSSVTDEGTVLMVATAKFDRRHIALRAPRFLIGRIVDITITASVRHVG
ncbi:YceI family protein [Kibdelosporangium philippinense]|uniref:YceI family protein n=1 Tax=Kibdelosporangium philippinense TaxID=211113 RepID=A0ABS8Z8C3_9PSEU|nr:YceI family protein [Kibdelosporangium philippinense]MCE7002906.1 YceI family protein [Kibdelosporangium philippinense]